MRNILESFYYGKEAISARTFKPATHYARLMEETSQLEDKLKANLPEETKSLFTQWSGIITVQSRNSPRCDRIGYTGR